MSVKRITSGRAVMAESQKSKTRYSCLKYRSLTMSAAARSRTAARFWPVTANRNRLHSYCSRRNWSSCHPDTHCSG